MRSGLCKGATTLPALSRIRLVVIASAACRTAGFGNSAPKRVKCRSGSQMLENPLRSPNRALSTTRRYLSPVSESSLLENSISPNFITVSVRLNLCGRAEHPFAIAALVIGVRARCSMVGPEGEKPAGFSVEYQLQRSRFAVANQDRMMHFKIEDMVRSRAKRVSRGRKRHFHVDGVR